MTVFWSDRISPTHWSKKKTDVFLQAQLFSHWRDWTENSPLMTFFNRDPFSSSDWLPFRFEFSRANSSQSEKRHRSLQNFVVSVAFLARREACASQCRDFFFLILAYLDLQMPGRLTLCGCLFLDTWRANACSPCDSSCAFVILRSYVYE